MNVLPVITRELRAEARSPFTYWLRVLGAGAVILTAVIFVALHGFNSQQGVLFFQQLHAALHLAILILVPLLTADCLSRERREGTLGLLFLTPLKAVDIVVAKSLAHGLRASTLLLAVLPVVTLPLLMGGVTWQQALGSLLVNGTALLLALAAGLLASALSKTWVRSLILAFCFAFVFELLFLKLLGELFALVHPAVGYRKNDTSLQMGFILGATLNPDAYSFLYYRSSRWGYPTFGIAPNLAQAMLLTATHAFWIALVALGIVVLLAAWITKRNWQERPLHPLALWFKNKLCTPVVMLDLLRQWMKRKLDHNPIGWLEQRTWSGRLVIWGWFAVMISVYSLVLTEANFLTRSFHEVHTFMGWVLLLSVAVNASTSFRRERETRVLELLLVSPLNEQQIILGRLRGLWGQFLPSMALLLVGWIYLAVALNRLGRELTSIIFITAAFAAIPVIGLYFSLVCRNFLTALIWTIAVGLIVPAIPLAVIGAFVISRGGAFSDVGDVQLLFQLPYELIVPGVLYSWLHLRLIQRRFAMESS